MQLEYQLIVIDVAIQIIFDDSMQTIYSNA